MTPTSISTLSTGTGPTLSGPPAGDAEAFAALLNGLQTGNPIADAGTALPDARQAVAAPAVEAPLPGLDVSLTVHTPQKMEINTGFSTFLPNGDLQRADRTSILAWEPWMFGIGAQYDFVRSENHRFGVVASATYKLWSDYRNRQDEQPQQGYEWSNTLAAGVGLRHVYDKRLTSYIDASYEPSPVPLQTPLDVRIALGTSERLLPGALSFVMEDEPRIVHVQRQWLHAGEDTFAVSGCGLGDVSAELVPDERQANNPAASSPVVPLEIVASSHGKR